MGEVREPRRMQPLCCLRVLLRSLTVKILPLIFGPVLRDVIGQVRRALCALMPSTQSRMQRLPRSTVVKV
jgi:hypothetical protein